MKKLLILVLGVWLVAALILKTGVLNSVFDSLVVGETQSAEELCGQAVFLKDVPEYYYTQLNENEQVWYVDMKNILGSMAGKTRLNEDVLEKGLKEEQIEKIFQAVMNDHPELFYISGYTYTKSTVGTRLISISFRGDYTMSKDEALQRKEWIERSAASILSAADRGVQYTKVKLIYESIIKSTEYDLDAVENQNIYSVLLNHSSVCLGYAKTFQYLCNELGIECILVQGTVDTGESHAWDCVKIDGDYYLVDATWGDASYRSKDGNINVVEPEITYDFLNVTTAEMASTHYPDAMFSVPNCTATTNNYYRRQGSYFTDYDTVQCQMLFSGMSSGMNGVSLKCANNACFQKMKKALIDRQEVFQFISGEGKSIAYTTNDNQLTLTFWMTSN